LALEKEVGKIRQEYEDKFNLAEQEWEEERT